MIIKGLSEKYIALALALIAIVFGVHTLFRTRGFKKTTAIIISIETTANFDDEDHTATVEYTVDGTRYTEVLDYYSGNFKVGKTVDILYDPNNPSDIHGGQWFTIYLIALGVVVIAVVVVSEARKKRSLEELNELRGKTVYAPSEQGEERELLFLMDTGTMKYGHRIEDASRRILYEAKMTKFTWLTPFGFDFIDHERGVTTPHLIGHTETSEWDTFLIDNSSTFTFDGEDIWQHLKRNGVNVDSSLGGGSDSLIGVSYRVYRDGAEIARFETAGRNAHKEDAKTKRPLRSLYRIQTRERNLDLLFVTLLAFARSDAIDDRGGHYGALFGKRKKAQR